MPNLVTVGTAARLNGDSGGTYRALINQYLRSLGERYGRERMVDLSETTLLRLVTEANSGNLNLKEASERAVGLLPYIKDYLDGKLGSGNLYALFFWGFIGGKQKHKGFVCRDDEHLVECIKDM